ncbi:Protein of unknown function [Bacillus mycoides]|nr:Protein of unknown function [Bacillus mycoides]SCM95704.1 Protein of unknown function [Bacillus mycoides]
MQAIPLRLAP